MTRASLSLPSQLLSRPGLPSYTVLITAGARARDDVSRFPSYDANLPQCSTPTLGYLRYPRVPIRSHAWYRCSRCGFSRGGCWRDPCCALTVSMVPLRVPDWQKDDIDPRPVSLSLKPRLPATGRAVYGTYAFAAVLDLLEPPLPGHQGPRVGSLACAPPMGSPARAVLPCWQVSGAG